MSSLGSLVVSITANTAQFSSDMGKAARIAAQNMEKMRKDAAMVGKAIGAMFAVGASAVTYLVKQSLETADAMLKMSQSAGMGIEKFTELSYAARLSGVETEAFVAASVRLTKGISDAAMGTGEARLAFTALGIEVKDSTGKLKSTDAVLAEMAGKFSKMADGPEKTALAYAALGRAGAKMIPTLNLGTEGFAQAADEARRLGYVMDKETAAAAERFNDNMTRLNVVKEGFANQIMREMLPSLEGLSKWLFDSASQSGGLSKAATIAAGSLKTLMSAGIIVAGVFKTLGESLGAVGAALVALFSGRFKEAFNIYMESTTDFAANVRGTVGAVNAIWDEAANQAAAKAPETGSKLAAPVMHAAKEAKKGVDDQIRQMQRLGAAYAQVFTASSQRVMLLDAQIAKGRQLTQSEQTLLEIEKQFPAEWVASIRPLLERAELLEKQRDAQERINALIEATPTAQIEKQRDDMILLAGAFESGRLSVEQYYEAVVAGLPKLKEPLNEMTEFSKQAARNMQDAMGSFFFDTMQGKMNDLAGNFKKTIDKMVADLLASQLMNWLTGDFGKTGQMGGALGNIFGSIFGGSRAIGGPVSAGSAYRVGEHGEEIFIPQSSGTVVPADRASSRSVVVNNTFMVSQPTDRRTQEQIAAMAGASIQTALSRGS